MKGPCKCGIVGKLDDGGRCERCARDYGNAALRHEQIHTGFGAFFMSKMPEVKTYHNCMLEVDVKRGMIIVSLPNGRQKVRIDRIPLVKIRKEMIDLIGR